MRIQVCDALCFLLVSQLPRPFVLCCTELITLLIQESHPATLPLCTGFPQVLVGLALKEFIVACTCLEFMRKRNPHGMYHRPHFPLCRRLATVCIVLLDALHLMTSFITIAKGITSRITWLPRTRTARYNALCNGIAKQMAPCILQCLPFLFGSCLWLSSEPCCSAVIAFLSTDSVSTGFAF